MSPLKRKIHSAFCFVPAAAEGGGGTAGDEQDTETGRGGPVETAWSPGGQGRYSG